MIALKITAGAFVYAGGAASLLADSSPFPRGLRITSFVLLGLGIACWKV